MMSFMAVSPRQAHLHEETDGALSFSAEMHVMDAPSAKRVSALHHMQSKVRQRRLRQLGLAWLGL
jgi:hypothetical protein